MTQNTGAQKKFNQLRAQAEALMRDKDFITPSMALGDPLKLIHELQTFQIELELQNEELRRSQQALMESQKSYAELYDFAPAGYVSLSLTGVILKSNLTFAQMLSMERMYLINQPLSTYIHFEDQDIYYRHLQALSLSKIRQVCDLRMTKKDGTPVDVRLESIVNPEECRDPAPYCTVVIDISEQKKADIALKKAKQMLEERVKDRTKELETANQKLKLEMAEGKQRDHEKRKLEDHLRRAQKMEALGTLSSGIAHDFNNILTSIIAFTQLLEMHEFREEEYVKNSLGHILQSAYQARDLVKHILLFSRKAEQIKEPVMLDLVIREVVQMMKASLPSTIHVREQINNEQGIVFADPVQMHQVVMNLCTNAAQAMADQGGILGLGLDLVKLSKDDLSAVDELTPGKYVQIIISDTGHGILPENLQRIFDPYFTTKKQGDGTGLGLSVTQSIIKNHKGAISVSSCFGQGTTFRVLVPYFLKQGPWRQESKPLPTPLGNAVILFVDDEVTIAMGVQMILKHFGYDIHFKTSGKQALNAFRKTPEQFDMVITDLTMPEMTGDVLAAEVKKIRPDIPVILCTGLLEETSETILSKYEVDGFIQKPYDKQALIAGIQRVTRQDDLNL